MKKNDKTAKASNMPDDRHLEKSVRTVSKAVLDNSEEIYVEARLNHPLLSYHALVGLIQTKYDISALDISNMWRRKELDRVIGERLEDSIVSFDIHRKNRLMSMSRKLDDIVAKRINEFEAGIDDPKDLMSGDDPLTSDQVRVIVKSTVHGMSVKDMASMAKDYAEAAIDRDDFDPNNNEELMTALARNYLNYSVNINIDASQFSVEEGFEGVSRDDIVIDVPKSVDEDVES